MSVDISLQGLRVMIGIPSGRSPNWNVVASLTATLRQLDRINIPAELGVVECGYIPKCRDEVLNYFFKSDANRLFWIDDDMTWTPEQFIRILAQTQLYDIVGATYPAKIEPTTYYMNMEPEYSFNEHGLLEVNGFGLGFTCCRREPLEELAATKPEVHDQIANSTYKEVFRTDIFEGTFRTEDMAFFADLRDLGYKVMLDPTVDLEHHGSKRYKARFLDTLKSITLETAGVA